ACACTPEATSNGVIETANDKQHGNATPLHLHNTRIRSPLIVNLPIAVQLHPASGKSCADEGSAPRHSGGARTGGIAAVFGYQAFEEVEHPVFPAQPGILL